MTDTSFVDRFAGDPDKSASTVNRTLGYICRAARNLEYPDADIALLLREFDRIAPNAKEMH